MAEEKLHSDVRKFLSWLWHHAYYKCMMSWLTKPAQKEIHRDFIASLEILAQTQSAGESTFISLKFYEVLEQVASQYQWYQAPRRPTKRFTSIDDRDKAGLQKNELEDKDSETSYGWAVLLLSKDPLAKRRALLAFLDILTDKDKQDLDEDNHDLPLASPPPLDDSWAGDDITLLRRRWWLAHL